MPSATSSPARAAGGRRRPSPPAGRRQRRRSHAGDVGVAEEAAGAHQHHGEQDEADEQLRQAGDLVAVTELAGDLVARR